MKTVEGWLLGVQVSGCRAVLWVKTVGGRVRLIDAYRPDLYLEPRGVEAGHLRYLLEEKDDLRDVTLERRVSSLRGMELKTVLRVQVDAAEVYRRVVSRLEASPFVEAVYDVDMSHAQRYLCDRGLIPMGRLTAEVGSRGRVKTIRSHPLDLAPRPPPLRVLRFEIRWSSGEALRVLEDEDRGEAPPALVPVGELLGFLDEEDPDIIVCTTRDLSDAQRYCRANGLPRFGVVKGDEAHLWKGRVHVQPHTYDALGLAGVAERVQYNREDPQTSADWGSGRAIESRQCYEARTRGILIPRSGDFQPVMTLWEMAHLDHGGLILTPDVGLHENVGVLDFESMFPSLMVTRNISYETVRQRTGEGFVVDFTREALDRRLHFKHMRRTLEEGSQEWAWCEGRQEALKAVLFCTYGYSGCWANRFGNFDTFMEINRVARETLVESMNVARRRGYRALYGNNDSLFLKRPGAAPEDYRALADEISAHTGLSMAVDKVFRYLVLLPQKGEERTGAANRYYGRTVEGRYVHRGIELRRSNTPPYVAGVQGRAIEALLGRGTVEEVCTLGVDAAVAVIEEACRRLRRGTVPEEELWATTVLRRSPAGYKAKLPHVAAAEALELQRMKVDAWTPVNYVYVDAGHSNRFRRVRPGGYGGKVDAEKYVELVREAGRSVLMPFDVELDEPGPQPVPLTRFM
ncbi:MAG TPA: DNA polymerase domain-containing protein [Candidatus Bathyarchaeia archaeon]